MDYKYDIAISYQSEIEETASKIAGYLEVEGVNVFYAPERQKELMSEKLNEVLYDIYKNQSLVRLLLVSDGYLASEWTELERRVSRGEEKGDQRRRIVVDYTNKQKLPDDLKSVVYIDGKCKHEDEVASMAVSRIRELKLNGYDAESNNQDKRMHERIKIINNSGIITGGNANFGDINFGR